MFLSKFDFISPEINLFYKGKERHSSIASGILSILLLIVIIALIIYLSIDCIGKLNPTSFYFTKYIDDVPEYPLNSKALLHYISIYNRNNEQIEIDQKAINVIGVNLNDGIFTDDNDISKYSFWIYESCTESDLGEIKDKFTETDLENFYNSVCISKYYDLTTDTFIDKNNENFVYPTLIHGASKRDNFEYGVYIQKCQNHKSINNNNCYSLTVINSFIDNAIGYEIFFIDHSVDVEDYKNPIISSIHKISSEINDNSYVLNHLNFHPVLLKTKDGLIFDNLKEMTSYNFDINEKITHINVVNGILGSFNFWFQNSIDIYDRTYKKIQDIAGGVDGIVEVVMFIAKIINQFLFHDFQVLKDFNYEFEEVNKKNKNSLFFFNTKKNKINRITSNHAISIMNFNETKTFTKRNGFFTNSVINNDEFNYEPEKFRKEKKNLSWKKYILKRMKIKKNQFIEFLVNKRELYISEEKLLEISLLQERMYEQLKKENNNSFKSEIKEKDDINSNILNSFIPSPLVLNK